jgi:hypothetical protein
MSLVITSEAETCAQDGEQMAMTPDSKSTLTRSRIVCFTLFSPSQHYLIFTAGANPATLTGRTLRIILEAHDFMGTSAIEHQSQFPHNF